MKRHLFTIAVLLTFSVISSAQVITTQSGISVTMSQPVIPEGATESKTMDNSYTIAPQTDPNTGEILQAGKSGQIVDYNRCSSSSTGTTHKRTTNVRKQIEREKSAWKSEKLAAKVYAKNRTPSSYRAYRSSQKRTKSLNGHK